jgi:hypothetical protein
MPENQPFNPYAPPGAVVPSAPAWRPHNPSNAFEGERRSVAVCLLLHVFTLGLYGPIWLSLRRSFLNGLDARAKLGSAMPVTMVLLTLFADLLSLGGRETAPVANLFLAIDGIVTISTHFAVVGILRVSFARSGRIVRVSSLWTFFFGFLYLQHKINEAADLPDRARATRE